MKNILPLAALLFACSVSHAAEKQTLRPFIRPESSKMAPRITLETDKLQYRGDEDIVLNVTIENIDTKPLIFSVYQVEAICKFEVLNAFGNKVLSNPVLSTASYAGFEAWSIVPGQKRKGFLYLNRAFDLSGTGKYTVSVTDILVQFDKIKITTKPLTIETLSKPILSGWLK